jgi:putative transposase
MLIDTVTIIKVNYVIGVDIVFNYKAIVLYVKQWLQMLVDFILIKFMSEEEKDEEIIALRSQIAVLNQKVIDKKIPKPTVTPAYRQLWVLLSKFYSRWKEDLVIVKPETVIGWHKTAFKFHWLLKSKKRGRPKTSRKTIELIKRIHKENPLLSPKKIHERLVDLNITDAPSPNTIAKYIPEVRKPPSEKQKQSWKTFLKNHRKEIWAMDFFTVPTLYFKVLYVFIIISHDRRKIEHFAVTTNPSSAWVAQQIREATPFGETPKYLIHDNDPTFTSKLFKEFLSNANIKAKRTGIKSPRQNGICERAVGILRAELLNHVIPFNQKHLEYLLQKYLKDYYHPVRTHQGLNCQTPILSDKPPETKVEDSKLVSKPILGGLYHSYKKVA